MKSKLLLGACAVLAMAVVSTASHAEDAKKTPNAYTECGIGASIFSNNHAAAAISNVIWDWGSTALSSALSSPDQCSGASGKTAMLVGTAYAGLETDLAVGEGKYLTAMADVMGCEASSRPALYAEVRNRFSAVATKPEFAVMSQSQKAEALYTIVDQTKETSFKAKCTAV